MLANAPNPGGCAGATRVFAELACALALWVAAGVLHAAPIFKCVDAQSRVVAYRDTPCPAHARQTRLELHAQPTIGDAGEVAAARARASAPRHERATTPSRRHSARRRRANPRMSWECHATDGEVFYRHKHCPGSVPGDGVVRPDYVETTSRNHGRRHRNAWSRVRVHGVKITRSEACRRIHSAGAAARDGHRRDATVSTYDHLMGRDPCIGS